MRSWLRRRALVRYSLLAAVVSALGAAPGDEPEEPVPGIIVSFARTNEAPPVTRRIVPDVTGDWTGGTPDARLRDGEFVARWSGLLLVQAAGPYRFFARGTGSVEFQIGGQPRPEGATVPLEPGFAAIEVSYRPAPGDARVAIDWEGPNFAREPLPARLVFHDRQAEPAEDRFEYGRRAADRYGCANCHRLLNLEPRRHLGPPLADAARTIDRSWLFAWLTDPTHVRPDTRMPAFGHGLSPADAADLAAFLDGQAPRKQTPPTNEIKMALNVASDASGRLLFRSLGCLGCHVRRGGKERTADSFGPDLADLGWKRSPAGLAEYLVHPKGKTSRHRADFRLSADESAHLAAYLGTPSPAHRDLQTASVERATRAPRGDAKRGRAVAERARCASCHDIPGLKPGAGVPLTAGSHADAGCLAAQPADWVPRFAFPAQTRTDLAALISTLPAQPTAPARETKGHDALRRWNCLGCHTRDGHGGNDLGAQVAALLGEDSALGGKKGTLTPPNLTAVGDKLRPEYLDLAVHGAALSARPWLSVRMPAFAFAPGEAEAIAELLRSHDRMSRDPDPPPVPTHPDARTRDTAAQLIGQRGFGCVSCHVLAGRIPPGGEPETLGPDLALAHRRMTERYFRRWIANPQRIIAGTPMPQFLQPIATVQGSLDTQLDTLWQLLGSTEVGKVAAFGSREFLKRDGDRALVVRDMVLLPDAPGTTYTPRALAIGLKNDHALLFDTDRLTWLSWWRGGFLSRTKSGRLWEWHPEGERLWIAPARRAPVAFLDAQNKFVFPAEERERFGSFRELEFEGSGVSLTYTLNLTDRQPVRVTERIRPADDGWERSVRVSGVPDGLHPALLEMLPATGDAATTRAEWRAGKARVTWAAAEETAPVRSIPGARLVEMVKSAEGDYRSQVRLRAATTP